MPFQRLVRPGTTTRWLSLCGSTLLALGVLIAPSRATAQPSKPEQGAAASAQLGPAWAALIPQQRQALAPLAATWDSLSAGQQRKWVEVSRNYPTLVPADQAKMHERMSEWVALSPRERSAARLNFAATTEIAKELSAQEKKAKWDAYQALSADERKKLAGQASRPPVGAATATRPVAKQKLAVLPGSSNAAAAARQPKISADLRPETATAPDTASTAAVPLERAER